MFPQYLMHSSMNIDWGSFHPVLVHFPIVLFTVALVCDLLHGFGKKEPFYMAHWLIIAGTLSALPTIYTGLEAAEAFDPNDAYVYKHKLLGFAIGIYAVCYTIFRILQMRKNWDLPPVLFVALSVILVALTLWTSDYGGLITRGSTPFSQRSDATTLTEEKLQSDLGEIQKYNVDEFEKYLQKNIGLASVVPIFTKHHCAQCHAENFQGGYPRNFSDGSEPEHYFLWRNQDGTLKDFEKSNFYQSVILKNTMPKNEHNESLGLSLNERLILLLWLKNNAPMH